MGVNAKAESNELVKRCEAVGWQVAYTGAGHYKIDTRKGTFTIPSTPGDSRSTKNSLADAKRFGLEDLEEKLAGRLERERLAKIATDRAANDAKLVKIQAANGSSATTPATPVVLIDTAVDVGHGLINGIAIADVSPATFKPPRGLKRAPLAHAEELLLADDTVIYRCKVVIEGQLCHQTFPSGNSMQVHISRHTRAQRDEEKVKTVIVENQPKVPTVTTSVTGATDQLKVELTRGLTSLVQSIDKIGASTIEARNALLALVDVVQDLKPEIIVQDPDPALVAKAKQFDALAETLGSLIKPLG